MKPGRELDAVIAQKVFGVSDACFIAGLGAVHDFTGAQGMPKQTVPRYSTDIAAAMEVAEMLMSRGFSFRLGKESTVWHARFYKDDEGETIIGQQAPHAICLAALRAVGIEPKSSQ